MFSTMLRGAAGISVAVAVLTAGSASAVWRQPTDAKAPAKETKATKDDKRVGDAYPLATCPISGEKLGGMGDAVVKLYEGREVRFCCGSCVPTFEKNVKASLNKLDEQIIKDQAPLYPTKTSVVTGKDLPEKPVEFVYGNRLIRVGTDAEKAEFLKDPKKPMETLDKAVIAAQSKGYTLKTCVVSDDKLDGSEGPVVDFVIAGRLVKLCCKDCIKEVEKTPSKYIEKVDAAKKGAPLPATKGDAPKDKHDHK